MSWFQSSTLDFAKNAFVKAQQQIDRVLDIQDEDSAKGTGSGHSTHFQGGKTKGRTVD